MTHSDSTCTLQNRHGWFLLLVAFCVSTGLMALPSVALAGHQPHPNEPHPPNGSLPHGIPNFCATPTISSVKNGPWSDPATWSLGRIPTTNDAVMLAANTDVLYDFVSDVALDCVRVEDDAKLRFKTDANTRLKVGILIVMHMGYLEIGTQANPVQAGVTAEVIIADKPLDTFGIDPEQFGTALIGLGKITMHGAPKTPTFVRLATEEPMARATTLFAAQPVEGWRSGDTLILPDTRHLTLAERKTYISQVETLGLAQVIAGNQLVLIGGSSLQFDHRGARNGDGVLEYLPHVANLTRNVVVRSENPAGTRGHVMFVHRADVDVRYALFKDLGRTKAIECLDSTLFDDITGKVIYIGQNQIGRYALHMHHLMGPVTTPSNGYQVTLIGNAINGSPKWGMVIHDTHFGLVQGNVVAHAVGVGITLEDGSEYKNIVEKNMVVDAQGSEEGIESRLEEEDFGHEGSGIWARGALSTIRDNVVASVRLAGFTFYLGKLGRVTVPNFPGADKSDPKQSRLISPGPIENFTGNEAYGATKKGLEFWFIGGTNLVQSFVAWHTHSFGVLPFYSATIRLSDVIVRGNQALLADKNESSLGIRLNQGPYIKDVTVANANIQGMRVGLNMPSKRARIQDGVYRNYTNAIVNIAQSMDVRGAEFRNVAFSSVAMPALATRPQRSIVLAYSPSSVQNLVRRDVARVYNYSYDGAGGGDLRLFYKEQDKAFVIPKLNLTNEEAWTRYGVAIADQKASCSDTKPEVVGFTCDMLNPGVLIVLASRSITNQRSYVLAYLVETTRIVEKEPTLLQQEGENTLTRDIDIGGGEIVKKTFWVTLDTVPPTIELDPKTPKEIGLINAKKFKVTYFFQDNLDGKKTKSKIFTNLPVGVNNLTITASDKAGNPATPITFTIKVDPTITEVIEDGLCGIGRRLKRGHKTEPR